MSFALVLLIAAAFGFAAGRWWVLLAAFAWTYYGAHSSEVQLEGDLYIYVALTTTVLVAAAIALGVFARRLAGRLCG